MWGFKLQEKKCGILIYYNQLRTTLQLGKGALYL